jgi:rRNA-processing protein FCF1
LPSDVRRRTDRPWVLLDTNAWFLPERAGTDLADEIDRKVPNARLGVPRSVLSELERLVERHAPGAELALALARTVEVVANTGRGDAGVEEVARRQRAWVVTADRRLATRLVEGGVPVLVPRDRVRLEVRRPGPPKRSARPGSGRIPRARSGNV